MNPLIATAKVIDKINERFGAVASWLVLISCVISAGNATSRYLLDQSSNGWLEIQWYMFSGIFLLGAPHTLKLNEHVRVDLVYMVLSERARLWVDIVGLILFLLPATSILAYMTMLFFEDSWVREEFSGNAGGLVRWPVKLLMPVGFALLTLQGLSELIKRIASMVGTYQISTAYERPMQ